MKGIIDVHVHILPGVDDGAGDWEETRWMLHCAYQQGIRALIATPHYSRQQDPKRLREVFLRLRQEAKAVSGDLHIYMGQEILYFDGLTEDLKAGKALTMAGSRYVLIEFMPETAYGAIYQAARKVMLAGYYPIAAHVERYHALKKPGRLEELKDMGCLLQMNYHSLEGGLLDRQAVWCRKQVLKGNIDLLGTDAHHRQYRTPDISGSLRWLEKHVDHRRLSAMAWKQAWKIIDQGMLQETPDYNNE